MQPAGLGAMGLMFLAPFVAGAAPAMVETRGAEALQARLRPEMRPEICPEMRAENRGELAVVFGPDLTRAVDWSPVKARLAPQLACLAEPPEAAGEAPVVRLARLLAESGAKGPVVLAARGAASPTVEAFAALNPHKVAGLVLVDPAPAAALNEAALVAKAGAMSRAEFDPWRAAAEAALAAGPLDRELPVAVVLSRGGAEPWRSLQAQPARRSRAGYLATVETRAGRGVSGPLAEAVARAVRHVRRLAVEPPMARAYA